MYNPKLVLLQSIVHKLEHSIVQNNITIKLLKTLIGFVLYIVIVQKLPEQTACFSQHAPLFPYRGNYFSTEAFFPYRGNYFPTEASISLQRQLFPDRGNYFLSGC